MTLRRHGISTGAAISSEDDIEVAGGRFHAVRPE